MIAALGSLAAPNPTFRFLSRGRQSSRGLSAPLTTAAAGGEMSDPNGIMNEQFMSVLKDSLSRQGEEALTEGPEADEFRTREVFLVPHGP